jgi:hypothetical protein
VSLEGVALIPRCVECGAAWLPADEERWRAYLGGDDLDEPPDLAFYCPDCGDSVHGQRAAYSFSARPKLSVCSITNASGISCPGAVR